MLWYGTLVLEIWFKKSSQKGSEKWLDGVYETFVVNYKPFVDWQKHELKYRQVRTLDYQNVARLTFPFLSLP